MKTLIGGAILFLFWISPLRKSSAETTPVKSANMADSIETLLIKHNVRFYNIVLAQSKLETGFYSSKIFRENKNTVGMKFNKRGYATGTKNGHAEYSTLEDCIIDYSLWQKQKIKAYEKRFGTIDSETKYMHFLNNIVVGKSVYRYATDPKYTDKLKQLKI